VMADRPPREPERLDQVADAASSPASLGDIANVGATQPSGSDAQAAAIAVGGTVGLCALVGGPLGGASMNPARSLGPALVAGELDSLWIYLLPPLLGAALGALAYQLLRGEHAKSAAVGRDA